MKKIFASICMLGLVFVLTPAGAMAAEFVGPTESDQGLVTVGNSETHKNLYAAGSTVFINGATQGDLYAGAGTLTIDGSVEQDLVAAGGTITVNGAVGGDIRVMGGTVIINGAVGGDIIFLGGTLQLTEKSKIAGDVIAAGGQLTIDAQVSGSLRSNGGTIIVNSEITGEVRIHSGDKVVFGPKAKTGSKVFVTAPQNPEVQDGASVTVTEFKLLDKGGVKKGLAAIVTVFTVIKLLAYALAGLLFVYVFKRPANRVIQTMHEKIWPNMGIGFAALIITIGASIALFLTIVGYYTGLVVLTSLLPLVLISCVVAVVYLGAIIVKILTRKQDLKLDWQAVLIGSAAFIILGLIPVVGNLVQAMLALAGFGAIVRLGYMSLRTTTEQ